MDASTIGCKIDLVQFTASKLPIKDSFVDIIVTDMVYKLISKNFVSTSKSNFKYFFTLFINNYFLNDLQPFGKRSGNKMYNRIFYKQFLLELGRMVKLNGRIVLLTYDRCNFKDVSFHYMNEN